MKVLFVTRWYPTRESTYSGVFVREHAKAVRAMGNDVVVVHLAGASRSRGLWQLEEEVDPDLTEGMRTFRITDRAPRGASSAISAWGVVKVCRRLRRLGFVPDVIHAHVFGAGLPAIVAGRAIRRPVVVTEHSTDFIERTLGRASILKARLVFSRAARVLPVSLHLQEAIESFGIRARFQVVPNAFDPAVFFPGERPVEPAGPKRLIFVGHLEPGGRKGFPTLVRALALTGRRDWHLGVVGGGPALGECERDVESAGLAGSVEFHGPVPKGRVAELMRASDIFVLPSRFENLPCVVIEAMASGLPVISTRVGGIPELVSDREGILVEPDDPAALASALDRMLSGSGSYDRLDIAAGARDRYSLEKVGALLQDVYAGAEGKR